MKKGILNKVFDIIKKKCSDPEFICDTADKIRMGINVSNSIKNGSKIDEYKPSTNISKYYNIHEQVMKEINSNRKKKDYYKRNPVTKEEIINVLAEAEKILSKSDYELYQKYYVHYHGGNEKIIYEQDDMFKANPNRK